jgi:hypothetical protein
MNTKFLALVSSLFVTGVSLTSFPHPAMGETVTRETSSHLNQIKPLIHKRETSVAYVAPRPNLTEKPAIAMPGLAVENTPTSLSSYSRETGIAYFITESETPVSLQVLSNEDVQAVIVAALPNALKDTGEVTNITLLSRDGYPGVRYQINLPNGLVSIQQLFIAGDRSYCQGANGSTSNLTNSLTNGFTAETTQFFSSIRFLVR